MPVALCTGGTGVPNTGSAGVVDYATGALSVYLSQYGAGWALRAIPFVGLAPLTLSTFCATDPPAIPTFTSAEAQAILDVTLNADFFSGISKLGDLLYHLLWYQNCHCSTGTPVPLPAAPAPPAGTPILQPIPQATGPCVSASVPLIFVSGASPTFTASFHWHGKNGTLLRFFGTDTPTGGGTHDTATIGGSWGALPAEADTFISIPDCTFASGSAFDCRWEIPATLPTVGLSPSAVYFRTHTQGHANENLSGTIETYCDGAVPNIAASSCCPPDPATQSSLDAILAMVTLIQRQHVPFASIHGAAHAGLSGTGVINVQGIIGLVVDVTTAPARLGTVFGDPVDIFGAGWVNVGTADGFGPRQWITSSHTLIEPIPSDATQLGYSIPADVTVTITELVREP